MANIIKKTVYNWMDEMLKHSNVLDVRDWEPQTMFEIDLHLPAIDMTKWKTIQRLKCKVEEYEYRDYTPASWNVETQVCTLYVEAGHNGAGSRWAKSVSKNDVVLLGPAHAAPLPTKTGKILCLGDGSALGHFFALKQLTNRNEYPLEAIVCLHENYQMPVNLLRQNPEFEFLVSTKADSIAALEQCITAKNLRNYSSIYIAGYIPMVTRLRKRLKDIPHSTAKIFAVGFWH